MTLKCPGLGERSGDLGISLNCVNLVDSMNILFNMVLIV